MEFAVFVALAAVAVSSAVATIAWKNPVRSALSLIVCLFALAGLYVTLYAHFLAAMQILVYAGAIMVLFVFVIMLLNLTPAQLGEQKVTPLAIMAGAAVAAVAGKFIKVIITYDPGQEAGFTRVSHSGEFGTIERVGDMLFRQFLMPFELTSILLLVAVVGAIIIARARFWREGNDR